MKLGEGNLNGHKVQMYTFDSAVDMYKVLFEQEIDYNRMIQIGTLALKSIGSYPIKDRLYIAQSKNFAVEMPCDWIEIVSVQDYDSYARFMAQYSNPSEIINYGLDLPTFVESSEEVTYYRPEQMVNQINNVYSISDELKNNYIGYQGKLNVPYTQKGNYLSFNQDGIYSILYKAAQLDDEDNMMFPEDSLLAIVYYAKWITEQAKPTMGNTIQYWLQMKDKYISMARNGGGLSDNALDKIMNIMTSHNRKRFGVQLQNKYR
jgi:hypothetical protein